MLEVNLLCEKYSHNSDMKLDVRPDRLLVTGSLCVFSSWWLNGDIIVLFNQMMAWGQSGMWS